MNDIFDLRKKLVDVFNAVESNSIEPGKAKLLVNTAGKIVGTARTQISYSIARGEKPKIAFVGDAYGK